MRKQESAFRLIGALLAGLLIDSARADDSWAQAVLAGLTLEEKAAQVQMVLVRSLRQDPQDQRAREEEAAVRDLRVGGIVVGRDANQLAGTIERLQGLARLPLLVASDLDWGDQGSAGSARLPSLMAIGAAGDEALAERAGRRVAQEARALGVRMMFAPMVDVNINPNNPIINVRSFGEDAGAVARLGSAFIRGARSAGVLTTAKHFPGHGATEFDSHRVLPTIQADRARLEAVELLPFRAAIAARVDAVMLGHLAVPALEPNRVPATVSRRIITGLLRGELAFHGLVLTDSLGMRAVTDAFAPGEAAVLALAAGADMLLESPDARGTTAAIVQAVRDGRLSRARLDEAVLHVLQAKAALELDRAPRPAPATGRSAAENDDASAMKEIAERSITLVRNERRIVPLAPGGSLLHIAVSAGAAGRTRHAQLRAELRRRVRDVDEAAVDAAGRPEARARIVARARSARAVVISIFLPITAAQGSSSMPENLARFVRRVVATGVPVVVVSYSSPYLLRQFPDAPAYLCAYSPSPLAQTAVVKALFGELAVGGRLPVTLPGLHPLGHGLGLPR